MLICGFSTATASASCVGIVGATLAAGVNNLQGVRGLLIDSLVSLRLITATGEIVNVSANENPHLFWALRGAGSNFGVVTSATYKIYDAINGGQVVNADYLYPASANRSVWKALESYDSTLPAQLALTAFVLANGTAREVSCPKLDLTLIDRRDMLTQDHRKASNRHQRSLPRARSTGKAVPRLLRRHPSHPEQRYFHPMEPGDQRRLLRFHERGLRPPEQCQHIQSRPQADRHRYVGVSFRGAGRLLRQVSRVSRPVPRRTVPDAGGVGGSGCSNCVSVPGGEMAIVRPFLSDLICHLDVGCGN